MARHIAKFTDKGEDFYLEWSTETDSPVTFGMSLDDFKDYYKNEYGREGMKHINVRLKDVEEKGTSSRLDDSVDELILTNRAGKDGTHFTKKQIIKWYCRRKEEPKEYGTRWNADNSEYEKVSTDH